MTSLQVFRRFIAKSPVDGSLDAAQVISQACYEDWSATHRFSSPTPEKFKRALLGHVTGVDGRVPFMQDEEEAVLKVVRLKQAWPLQENSGGNLGLSGFRGKGFHEKSAMGKEFLAKKQAKKGIKMLEENGSGSTTALEEPAAKRIKETAAAAKSAVEEEKIEETVTVTTPSSMATPSFETVGAALSAYIAPTPTAPPASGGGADPLLQVMSSIDSFFADSTEVSRESLTSVFSLGRMMCLARGWISGPTLSDAEAMGNEMVKTIPSSHALTLMDFTAKFEDRVLFQNARSFELFGNMCRHLGGVAVSYVGDQDLLPSFRVSMSACSNPGTEFHYRTRINFPTQPELSETLCDVYVMWNAQLRIFSQRVVVPPSRD